MREGLFERRFILGEEDGTATCAAVEVDPPGTKSDTRFHYRVWYDLGDDRHAMVVLRTDAPLDPSDGFFGEKLRVARILREANIAHEGIVVIVASGAWVARDLVPLANGASAEDS